MMHDVMRLRPSLELACLLLLAGLLQGQLPTCPGQGPALSVIGGRLGDPWTIGLSGQPNAAAILAVDSAGGPVTTPFGSVCLGLTPSLWTIPITLSPAGTFSTIGALPLVAPTLAGASVFLQGAAADASLPGGFGMTNGWAVTFRPPRIAVFEASTWAPFTAPHFIQGSYVAVDPVTDAVVQSVPKPIWGLSAIRRIPRLGWFAIRGTQCFDDVTGANTIYLNGVVPGGNYLGPEVMEPSADGSLLFATQWWPVAISAYSLPSGALAATAAVPGAIYAISTIHPIPGTSLAYLGDSAQFHVFDVATSSIVATVALGSPMVSTAKPLLAGNLLYVQTNAGLAAIDVTTHAVVTGPVPLAQPNPVLVAHGPGFLGPALFVLAGNSLLECSPTTLAVQNVIALPGQPLGLTLSTGGTEWLIEVLLPGATQPELRVMSATALLSTSVIPSVVAGSTTALRSGALNKAYVLLTPSTLAGIPTDPIGGPGPPIALPVVSAQLRVLSN
jgi:hypothetical protein